nr:DUF2075 domain-containing protein [Roseomonas acroporae]
MSLPVASFLATPAEGIVARLADAQSRRFRGGEPAQSGAWDIQVATLRRALAELLPEAAGWHLLLEYDLLRLEKRIDAVLLTDRAVFSLEFKCRARRFEPADQRQAEDYALDLHDFHAGCRAWPVIPVLVATEAPTPDNPAPLLLPAVAEVQRASAASLPGLLRGLQAAIPAPATPLDAAAWLAAPYRPVPNIVEAATLLYARNSVAEIAATRADAANLGRTTAAIRDAIARAAARGERRVLFVTGIPGAGKTLCGLNAAFGALRGAGAAFLTGNAPLVAVLREALARNAAGEDRHALRPARQRTTAALQNVHRFLEQYVERPGEAPHEHVVVFDEAQRAWDADKARRDTQNRRSRLSDSEPAHMLEIMGRHPGWAVVVALVGNGQEINTGEAGLAEWGRAIAASGAWRALASPAVIGAGPPAQRLAAAPAPWLDIEPALHLDVPMRSVRSATAAPWVDAVLASDTGAAGRIAAADPDLPFLLTRDLGAMRGALRRLARGERRAGLVASSGARRLRAEGLGAEMRGDDATVAWFLERWPDIRASDALEVPATEYACQGLELDLVGLCWGGDLVRAGEAWAARRLSGTRWQREAAEGLEFVRNTYRVLLTRARYETVVWVPPGDDDDPTRPRAQMDAIAAHLLACGARPLAAEVPAPGPAPDPPPRPAQALLL